MDGWFGRWMNERVEWTEGDTGQRNVHKWSLTLHKLVHREVRQQDYHRE